MDPERVKRLSEASNWLLRLQAAERSEANYDEWLRWCDGDPENLAAFETVLRRWQELDALKNDVSSRSSETGRRDFNFALTPEQKAALLAQQTQGLMTAGRRSGTAVGTVKAARVTLAWAVAASVAVIALIFGAMRHERERSAAPPRQVTATLTNRAATLPDGSKMILGAQSLVNMDFNGRRRELALSSGEAYFKVKHDETRPFVVQAGEVSVTAIGTAFDVRRNRNNVTVTVEEGTVEVRYASPGKRDTVWRAEAGHQLTYSTGLRTASLASIDPSLALTWRSGELAYLHEPLGAVVDDLNRYSARKIVIVDPEVAQIPFTGTAFAASPDGWLAGVEQAYPVDVTELASGEVILSARKYSRGVPVLP